MLPMEPGVLVSARTSAGSAKPMTMAALDAIHRHSDFAFTGGRRSCRIRSGGPYSEHRADGARFDVKKTYVELVWGVGISRRCLRPARDGAFVSLDAAHLFAALHAPALVAALSARLHVRVITCLRPPSNRATVDVARRSRTKTGSRRFAAMKLRFVLHDGPGLRSDGTKARTGGRAVVRELTITALS